MTTEKTQTQEQKTLMGAAFLVGAAFFWGFGFYAQRVSIEDTSPLWATALRFLVASPLAAVALVWRMRAGVVIPWRAGGLLGVLLYVVFALQTVALVHTPVSRVALITGMYAVFTPLLQPLFKMPRPTAGQLVSVVLAVAGLVLLCGVIGDDKALSAPANIGDLLTLIMAVIAAVMVLLIARFAPKEDAVALNVVQILVMCGVAVICAPLLEGAPPESVNSRTWIALLYLAIASTFLAFLFQMLGQKHVSPATASVLMLLETPIGVMAAVVILDEGMAGLQWVGAGVALIAVAVAVVAERKG